MRLSVFVANARAIADVRMVRNRDNDRPRGYFLEFEDVTSLERALKFDQSISAVVCPRERRRVHPSAASEQRRVADCTRIAAVATVAAAAVSPSEASPGGRDGFTGGGGSFGRREGGGGYQERAAVEAIGRSFDRSRSNSTRPSRRDARSLARGAHRALGRLHGEHRHVTAQLQAQPARGGAAGGLSRNRGGGAQDSEEKDA